MEIRKGKREDSNGRLQPAMRWVTLGMGLAVLLWAHASWSATEDVYAPLKRQLTESGLARAQVASALDQCGPPLYKVIAATFRLREGRLNYDQFLEPGPLAKARRFQNLHASTLRQAERQFGVDGSVIVAILLVETQLGHYTGKTPTLAVLSTFALMDRKPHRDAVWALLAPKERKHWGREAFDEKLLKRSQWAMGELEALMRWSAVHGLSPNSLNGSVMGAVGWCQFLPSSMVKFAQDGNADGLTDLYTAEDAIHSIANYLRGHGWTQAKTSSEQEAVIHAYNHSRPYVRTVLEVASRLRAS